MPTYKITSNLEEIIEADDQDEAINKFFKEVENEPQQTLATYLNDNLEAKEICPHCEIALEPKMIDVDGTNIQECMICPECGYGTPALR